MALEITVQDEMWKNLDDSFGSDTTSSTTARDRYGKTKGIIALYWVKFVLSGPEWSTKHELMQTYGYFNVITLFGW